MFLAIGIVTCSALRPSRGDTNKVWRRGWSRSMTGVESGSQSVGSVGLTLYDAFWRVCKNLEIQCPLDGLVDIPKQQTPHGWPETDVFVLHDMPRRMCPWRLMEVGFVLSRSRNLSEAMVAMRKHSSVTISAGLASLSMMRFSQAASTVSGMGVASDLSKGIRVFDLRKAASTRQQHPPPSGPSSDSKRPRIPSKGSTSSGGHSGYMSHFTDNTRPVGSAASPGERSGRGPYHKGKGADKGTFKGKDKFPSDWPPLNPVPPKGFSKGFPMGIPKGLAKA